jgi:expansin (peptidoglycan-binding protein)
MYQGDSIVYF